MITSQLQFDSNDHVLEEKRVLIVDDDIDFSSSLSEILAHNKYITKIADNIRSANSEIKSFYPHIALIDIRLGVDNGIDLLKILRSKYPEIICIMITAYSNIDTSIEALRLGAYDYLRKPVIPDELIATLNRCFEKLYLEKEKKLLVKKLKGEIAARRKVAEALTSLRKEEDVRQRKKIAAELHDILGQSLQSIKLLFKTQQAEMLNGKIPELDDQNQLLDEIDLAIKQIRQMTSELRPIFLDTMDILQAICSHNDMVNKKIKLNIVVDHDHDHYELTDMIKEYCFLIYREVLINIIKHANATQVNIKLRQTQSKWLQIEIADNGDGFDINSIKDKGHGLVLMQDRTCDVGGNVDIKSVPGEGTSVYIKIPTNELVTEGR